MQAALNLLGFPCYHMQDVPRLRGHLRAWEDLLAGRGAMDWKTLFRDHEATVDAPACFYYETLMREFPEAKVVLTVRDPDRWFDSTMARHSVGGCGDSAPISRASGELPAISRGFWQPAPSGSEPETARWAARCRRFGQSSLPPTSPLRFRSRFASARPRHFVRRRRNQAPALQVADLLGHASVGSLTERLHAARTYKTFKLTRAARTDLTERLEFSSRLLRLPESGAELAGIRLLD